MPNFFLTYLKYCLLSVISVFIQLNLHAQVEESDFEEDKCYGKCGTQSEYDTTSTYYYTIKEGVSSDKAKLKKVDILFIPEDHYWIKSINLEDESLNWYMNRNNISKKQLIVVKNWRKLDPDSYDIIEIIEYRKYGNLKAEWYEVVCSNNINQKLISEVKVKLIEKGYLPDSARQKYFSKDDVLTVLLEFQKDNGLPLSNFNLKTLDFLEINY